MLTSVFTAFSALAQWGMENPVEWSATVQAHGGHTYLHFSAAIDEGWHIYDMDLPSGGPTPTSFHFDALEGCHLLGEPVRLDNPRTYQDQMFGMEVRQYERKAAFEQEIQPDSTAWRVEGHLRYMSCNDQNCLPPTAYEFALSGGNAPAKVQETIPTACLSDITDRPELWTPVVDELHSYGQTESTAGTSHWRIFLLGFVGGLLALVTPCVWPIIPMTVSFFLKRTRSRRKAIGDALSYGLAIVVIYVGLGLAITLLFGASALNSLATNAVFNLLFFALLVAFALSFFGLFELVLPSSWSSRMDARADGTSGLLSSFFMAFTLVLVSFSCTGPIIGTLLVEAATQGSLAGPTIGMLGFALALALPFSLFAMFPNIMQSMPKSGGWLQRVKVVLGFIELAFALKFFSVADMAYGWGIMPRDVFMVLWIAIFAACGLYLLGVFRFPGEEKGRVSWFSRGLGVVSLLFALYLVPGLLGAPAKAVSAFAPPMSTQHIHLFHQEVTPDFYQYEEAMAYAAECGKPVLIDFSGFGCVNCRKMENAVWTDPRVQKILKERYVLVSLMVDDKTPLPRVLAVEEAGKVHRLRTLGDKWSYLQRSKFGANAQPFYVVVDADGKALSGSYSFNDSPEDFLEFLEEVF